MIKVLAIKLVHHQFTAVFIGKEQGTVGWECTDHSRFQSRVQGKHTYEQDISIRKTTLEFHFHRFFETQTMLYWFKTEEGNPTKAKLLGISAFLQIQKKLLNIFCLIR